MLTNELTKHSLKTKAVFKAYKYRANLGIALDILDDQHRITGERIRLFLSNEEDVIW